MHDSAYAKGFSEASKWDMLRMLKEWTEETFPGYTIAASVELSYDEAKEMSKKIAGMEFGIYVRIKSVINTVGNGSEQKLL